MRQTIPFKTGLAVLCGLILTATGLWAAGAEEEPAAAADKKYVTDPTTGKVVVAPEYGGTLTVATNATWMPFNADTHFSHVPTLVTGATTEKLGIMDWAIDRDIFSFSSQYLPLSLFRPHLAESWTLPTHSRLSSRSAKVLNGKTRRRWMGEN